MISRYFARAALLLSVSLAACGGGGGGAEDSKQTSPDPTEEPATVCKPAESVSIQLWGDSTNYGATFGPQGIYRVAQNPEWVIQSEMDQQFGAGVVKVSTFAVPNTTAVQMLSRADGGTWPPVGADIVLVNHGINDRFEGQTPEQFAASLEEISKVPGVVLETPLPLHLGPLIEPGYAKVVRDFAEANKIPLIDVSAVAMALPNWGAYLVDGIHPASEGYGLVTRSAVVPKLTEMVAKLRCQ